MLPEIGLSNWTIVTMMTIMTRMTYIREGPMTQRQWTVAEAKAHLSEVIEKAKTAGPQKITRHGKDAVVVVSVEEWERKTSRVGTLADVLLNSPLKEVELDLERIKDEPREIEL
jgi:prevent-host-death family protein